MTMTAEQYIAQVVDPMPRASLRAQVAMELRGHIAERVAAGQPLDEVFKQLGDPATLASSYLSAEPMKSAGLLGRVAAKIIDVLLVILATVPAAFLFGALVRTEAAMVASFVLAMLGVTFGFAIYTIVAESQFSQTIGKRVMRLRVVAESGARISFGQAIVRQLPMFFQVAWLDAAFALFTEKSQRAVEMLSKTRTIDVSQEVQ